MYVFFLFCFSKNVVVLFFLYLARFMYYFVLRSFSVSWHGMLHIFCVCFGEAECRNGFCRVLYTISF